MEIAELISTSSLAPIKPFCVASVAMKHFQPPPPPKKFSASQMFILALVVYAIAMMVCLTLI
jgi:hypothetical protein